MGLHLQAMPLSVTKFASKFRYLAPRPMNCDSNTPAIKPITVRPQSCRRCSAGVAGTSLRCPHCHASTLPRSRIFRKPRDFAIAGCCLFVWWLFCLNGMSSCSIVLSSACEQAGLYRPSLYFAQCANDNRIKFASSCMTCDWELQRTFDDRIQRISQELQAYEADQ